MKVITASVLVIGGGGAGLRAALAAHEVLAESAGECHKAPVLLATKGRLGKSGVTALACSDRMAFHATLPYTAPGGSDNWKYHAADIYRLGGYVSDADLALTLAEHSGAAVEYLADKGVPFARTPEGRFSQFVTDGSEYPRALYTGPYTANHIEQALVAEIKRLPVKILEETMLVDLALDGDGAVCGAYLLDASAELLFVATPSVILATGGAGEAFEISVFPAGQTGDGYAAAYRAGASLVNLEFIQIGLCSVATKLACSGSLMRAIPRFVNDLGEEFLPRYFDGPVSPGDLAALVFRKGATWPVSFEHPTHRIDVAVFQEILAGRRVFLDFSANPSGFGFSLLSDDLKARYATEATAAGGAELARTLGERESSPLARLAEINPPVIEWFAKRSIYIAKGDRIEIAPAIQHFQGGIKIDRHGESTVPGLFAAGETAGGQHGANRPGGNALLDAQVFGRLSGEAAARRALERGNRLGSPDTSSLPDLPDSERGRPATEVRAAVRRAAYRSAGVIRTAAGLAQGLAEIATLRQEGVRRDGKGLVFALETRNMLQVSEMVLRACAARPESRGPHLFFAEVTPHAAPEGRRDPEWQKYLVVQHVGSEMTINPALPVKWDEPDAGTGAVE